jgi:PAS domain S-box-containing protein
MTRPAGPPETMGPSRLSFRVTPDPTHLVRSRERVRDYLHQHCSTEQAVDQVVLAVDEACTNALRHSGATEDLEIRLGFDGGDLVVEVRDHGRGLEDVTLDPDHVPDPLANDGRGMYLIRSLMDEVEFSSDRGLLVRMVKRSVRRPGSPNDADEDGLDDVGRDPDYWHARRRAVIEELGEAFAALDWEYRFVYGNQAALDLYGRTSEEAYGRSLWEVFPTADALPVGPAVRRAMELGISSIEEFVSPGIGRWVECRVYPTSHGVNVFVRDIDERKHREIAHEEGQLRAELLASTTARLLSAEEPQRVVDDLCRDVLTHLGCHVFFNYLVDADAGCLMLNAYAGIEAEQARSIEVLDFGVAVCGCAAAQAERIVSEDVQHNGDKRAALVRSYGVQVYAAHPLVARGEVLGTLSFGARDRTRFTDDELALMRTVADQVAIAIDRDRTERELRRRDAEAAAQDERGRLARDLHDSVTQALFAASLKAEAALTACDGQVSSDAAESMEQVRRLNRGALAQMRTMLLELRGDPIEDVPLQHLLRNLVETAESRAGVDVSLAMAGESKVPPRLHVTLYRVAQEALNNVVRHAKATHATVDLVAKGDHVSLLVHDDGCGFEPGEFGPTHLGLRSMRERAEEIGAELSIVSAPGEGTLVRLDWRPDPESREGASSA